MQAEPSGHYFLPSEICRLVLGFLKDGNYLNTYKCFLKECVHLREYESLLKQGQEYPTTIMGLSLLVILKEYVVLKHTADGRGIPPQISTPLTPKNFSGPVEAYQQSANAAVRKLSQSARTKAFMRHRMGKPSGPLSIPRCARITSSQSDTATSRLIGFDAHENSEDSEKDVDVDTVPQNSGTASYSTFETPRSHSNSKPICDQPVQIQTDGEASASVAKHTDNPWFVREEPNQDDRYSTGNNTVTAVLNSSGVCLLQPSSAPHNTNRTGSGQTDCAQPVLPQRNALGASGLLPTRGNQVSAAAFLTPVSHTSQPASEPFSPSRRPTLSSSADVNQTSSDSAPCQAVLEADKTDEQAPKKAVSKRRKKPPRRRSEPTSESISGRGSDNPLKKIINSSQFVKTLVDNINTCLYDTHKHQSAPEVVEKAVSQPVKEKQPAPSTRDSSNQEDNGLEEFDFLYKDMSEDTVSNIITRTKNDPIFDELFEIFGKEPEPEGLHTPPHCSGSEAGYPGTDYASLPSTAAPASAASVSSSLDLSSRMQQATLSFSTECIDLSSMSGFPDLAVGEHGPQTFSTQLCHDAKTDEIKGAGGQGNAGNCAEQGSENSVANCENVGSDELGEHRQLSERLLQEQTQNTESPKHMRDATPSVPCGPPVSCVPAVDLAVESVVMSAHDTSKNTCTVSMNTSTESAIINPHTCDIANSFETQKASPLNASASETVGRTDTVTQKYVPSHTPNNSIAENVEIGNTSISTEHSYCHSGREPRAPVNMCEETAASSSLSSFPATPVAPDTEPLSLHQNGWGGLAMSEAAEETDGGDVVFFDGTRYGAVVIRDESGVVTERQPSVRANREECESGCGRKAESVSGDQMETAMEVNDRGEAQTAEVALQPSGTIEVDTGMSYQTEGQKSQCVLGERGESTSTDIPPTKLLSVTSAGTSLLSLETLQSVKESRSQTVPDDSHPLTKVNHDLGSHLASVSLSSASVETEHIATSTQNFDATVILQSASVTQSSCSIVTPFSPSVTQNSVSVDFQHTKTACQNPCSVTENCALSATAVTPDSTLPVSQGSLPSSLTSSLPSVSQQSCAVMSGDLVTTRGSMSAVSDNQGHAVGDTRENSVSVSQQNSMSGTAQHSTTVAAQIQLPASGHSCKNSDAATVTFVHPSKIHSSQEVQTVSGNWHVGNIQRYQNLSRTVKALISPIKKMQPVSLLASQSAHKTQQSPLAEGHCHEFRTTTSAQQTSALGSPPFHCRSSLSDPWPCQTKVPAQLSWSPSWSRRRTKSVNALELLHDDRAHSITAAVLLRRVLAHLPRKSFTGVGQLADRESGFSNQSGHSLPGSRGKRTVLTSPRSPGNVGNSASEDPGIFVPSQNPESVSAPRRDKLVTETPDDSAVEECPATVSVGAERNQIKELLNTPEAVVHITHASQSMHTQFDRGDNTVAAKTTDLSLSSHPSAAEIGVGEYPSSCIRDLNSTIDGASNMVAGHGSAVQDDLSGSYPAAVTWDDNREFQVTPCASRGHDFTSLQSNPNHFENNDRVKSLDKVANYVSLASNQSTPAHGLNSVCASSVPQSPCTASQSSSSTPQRVPTRTPELANTPLSLKHGAFLGSLTTTAQQVPCRASELLCSHSLLPVSSGQQVCSGKKQPTPSPRLTISQLPVPETPPQTNVAVQPVLSHACGSVTSKDQQVLAHFPALRTDVARQESAPKASTSAGANDVLREHVSAQAPGSGATVLRRSTPCSPLQSTVAVLQQVPPSTPPRIVTDQVKHHTPQSNKSHHVTPPSQHTPQRIPPATPPRSGISPRRTSPRTPKRTSPFAYGHRAFTSPRRASLYSPIKSPYSPGTGASITSLFSPRRKRLLNEPIPEDVLEELSRHSDSCFSDVPSSKPGSVCGNCEGAEDEENCHNTEGNNTTHDRLGPFSQVAQTQLPRDEDSLSCKTSNSQPRDLHLSCSSQQTASSSELKNFRVVGTVETGDLSRGRLINVGDLPASDDESSKHSATIFSTHVVYQEKGKAEEKIGKGTQNSKAAPGTDDTVDRELSTGDIFISPGVSDDAGRTNISMPILPLAVSQFLDNQIQTGELQVPLDFSSDLSLQKTPTKSKTTPRKITPNKSLRQSSPLKKMSTNIGQFASLSRNKTSARKTSPRKCVTSGVRQSLRKRLDMGKEVSVSQKSPPKRLCTRNQRKVRPSTNQKGKVGRTECSVTVSTKTHTLPAKSSVKKTVSGSTSQKQANKGDSSESDFSIHTSSSDSEDNTSSDDDLPLSELVKVYSQKSTASTSSKPEQDQNWTKLQKQAHGVLAAETTSCLSTTNSDVTPGSSQHIQCDDRHVESVQQSASVVYGCTIAEDVQPSAKPAETILPFKKRLLEVQKLGITEPELPMARKRPVAKKNLQLLLNKQPNSGRKLSSPNGSDADSFDGHYDKESSKMSGTGSSSVEIDVCVLSESENSDDCEIPTSQSERKKQAIIAARRSTLQQKLKAKKKSSFKHGSSPESLNSTVKSTNRSNTASPSKDSSESPVHATKQDKSKSNSKKLKSPVSSSVMSRKSPEDTVMVTSKNMNTELPVKSAEPKNPIKAVPSVEMQNKSSAKESTTSQSQTVMPQQHGHSLSTANVAQSRSVGHSSGQQNTTGGAGNSHEQRLGPGQLVQTQPFSYTALRQPEAVGIQAFGPHRRIIPTLISKTTTSYFPPLKSRMGTRQNGQGEMTSDTTAFPVFSIFSAPSPCPLLSEVSQGVSASESADLSSPPPPVAASAFQDGHPVSKLSSASLMPQPVASTPKSDAVFNSAQAKASSIDRVAESTDGKFSSTDPRNPGESNLKKTKKSSSISPSAGKKAADSKGSTKSSRRKGVKKQGAARRHASSSSKCPSHSVAGKESLDPPHTSDIIDHGLCATTDETEFGNEVNNCQTFDSVETEEAVRALEEIQASDSYIYAQPIQNDDDVKKPNETDMCRDAEVTTIGADKYRSGGQSESPDRLVLSKEKVSRKRKNSSSVGETSGKRARKGTALQKEQIGSVSTAAQKLRRNTREEQNKAVMPSDTGTDDTDEVRGQLLSMPFLGETSRSPIKLASMSAERDSEPAPLNVISIMESGSKSKTVKEKACSKSNLLGKSGVGKSVETSASISGNSIIHQFSSLLNQVESEKQNNPPSRPVTSSSPVELPSVEQHSMQCMQKTNPTGKCTQEMTNDQNQTIQGSRDYSQKDGTVLMNTSKQEQLLEELKEMRSALYAARTQKRREMGITDRKQQGGQQKKQRKYTRSVNTGASSSSLLQQSRQKVSPQTISLSLCNSPWLRQYQPILPKGMEGKTPSDVNASSPPRAVPENPLDAAMMSILPELVFSPGTSVHSNTSSAAEEKATQPRSEAEKKKNEAARAIQLTERTETARSRPRVKKNGVKTVSAAVLDDLESPAPLVIDDGVQMLGAEASLHVSEKDPQNARRGGKGKNKAKGSATLKPQKFGSVQDTPLDASPQSKDVSAQRLFQYMMDPPVPQAVPVPEYENDLSLSASNTLSILAPMLSIGHTPSVHQNGDPLTSQPCTVASHSTCSSEFNHTSVSDVYQTPARGVNNASTSLQYTNSVFASDRQAGESFSQASVSQMSVATQPSAASEGSGFMQAQSLPVSVKPSAIIEVRTQSGTRNPIATGLVTASPSVATKEPASTASSHDGHPPAVSTSLAVTSLHALSSVDSSVQQKSPDGQSTVVGRASESPRLQAAETLASIAVLGMAARPVKTVPPEGASGSRSTHKLSKIDRLNGINIDKFLHKKALKLKSVGSEKKQIPCRDETKVMEPQDTHC